MYSSTAHLYDALYSFKDYAGEAEEIYGLIRERRPEARTLLEVAAGTGRFLAQFRRWYEVEGTDIEAAMLAVARERLPDVALHEADMTDFDLGRKFDAVACLFSSIGYAKTEERMRAALEAMARHLEAGGVVVVDPWFGPDAWIDGHVAALFVDEPQLKIARINNAAREGDVSVMDMHHLVGTPAGVEHVVARHELGLFSVEQYEGAFRAAGLDVEHFPEALNGRGRYVGVKRRP
jgi:ubiquinone/menaquinone biosynthesis C-methylase UbiE